MGCIERCPVCCGALNGGVFCFVFSLTWEEVLESQTLLQSYSWIKNNCVGTMNNSTEGNRSHILLMSIVYLVFICASYQKKKTTSFLDLDCSNLFYHSQYTQVHPSYNFLLSGKKRCCQRPQDKVENLCTWRNRAVKSAWGMALFHQILRGLFFF